MFHEGAVVNGWRQALGPTFKVNYISEVKVNFF
jgi:hypothetical protein